MKGQWVFGGCESMESSNCFMVPVEKRDKDTLIPLIQRYINPGSVIVSDCWAAYNCNGDLPQMYTHLTVNHSENYVDPISNACTNTVEGSWRHLKKSLPTSVREGQYSGFLASFLWFKTNKKKDMFRSMVRDISEHFPPIPHNRFVP